MAVMRSRTYRSGLAFLIWLQKIEKCLLTKYDIDIPEMEFVASKLSPQECYDFYHLLSHRRNNHGESSIYAEKEKTRAIPCINLLATWITDPDEISFRSHENIELKLRTIGRKDLARWILGKIDSSLQRRQLDLVDADYRKIEESEKDDVIVRKRIGGRIMPSISLDYQTGSKNEVIGENYRDSPCVFWKIFFSVLIVLLLVLLFLCSYRFLYTKLRCICRRFAKSEDRERCLPEQTYGTSCVNTRLNSNAKGHFSKYSATTSNHRKIEDREKENALKNNFSSENETNEEIVLQVDEEKKALLHNFEVHLTNRSSSNEDDISLSRNNDGSLVNLKVYSTSESERLASSPSRISGRIRSIAFSKINVSSFSEKSLTRGRNTRKRSKKCFRSLSEAEVQNAGLSLLAFEKTLERKHQKTVDTETKLKDFISKKRSIENSSTRKLASYSCDLIIESPKTLSRKLSNKSSLHNQKRKNAETEDFDELSMSFAGNKGDENLGNSEDDVTKNPRAIASSTDLSETYDELGMLFSQHMKLQSRPCRRKYCPLARNLRAQKSKTIEHDERKCRSRIRANLSLKLISVDQRPACSTGNICKETYDEFELMRASRKERASLARSIVDRRKHFLDEPCVSPIATQRFDESVNFFDQTQ